MPHALRRTKRDPVKIDLISHPRFNAKPPSFTPTERRAWEKWFVKALQNDWIEPSTARHSSSILFVPKPGSSEPRVCINYVKLNNHVKPRIYAPRCDRMLRQHISKFTWYSKIDLKDAFFNVPILSTDRWKTAFRTPQGIYQWKVLPMGLNVSPGEFQLLMEELLAPFLGSNCAVHIDDVLIFAHTRHECESITSQATAILEREGLHVNEEKSVYLVREVTFCGFTYSNGRIIPPDRSESLRTWPTPRNPTELRSFLGTVNELRDHVPRFAGIAAPLYSSTNQDKWTWTPRQNEAFIRLRQTCCKGVELTTHIEQLEATLETDASLFGISAVIRQKHGITAIWSRTLLVAERNYPANERELLAVVEGLRKFVHLLEVSPLITVVTDNKINATNVKPNQSNRRVNRWIEDLMRFNLKWTWRAGADNQLADALSRRADYKKLPRTR